MNNNNTLVSMNYSGSSYQPLPFFEEQKSEKFHYRKKLDLNLYCVKHPKQTCFIHISNPNLLAWGIEAGDMLVVEKSDKVFIGEFVVMEIENNFCLYELIAYTDGEFVFLSLDKDKENIKTSNWNNLPIVEVVTNIIHQLPRKRTHFIA